jgi:hypothetical protein
LISIPGAPIFILARTVFGFKKSYGTIHAAIILMTTAIILILGMIAERMLLLKINEQFVGGGTVIIPYIFIIAGMGIAILGIYLFKKSKNYRNLEVEIH